MVSGIAHKLDVIFAHLRKSDNTLKPLNTLRIDYDLEYGLTEIHIHRNNLDGFSNALIIYDLLETDKIRRLAIKIINRFDTKI
jgi:adenine/guanine phosphoribosyltransferase-like PRPP-binding protein